MAELEQAVRKIPACKSSDSAEVSHRGRPPCSNTLRVAGQVFNYLLFYLFLWQYLSSETMVCVCVCVCVHWCFSRLRAKSCWRGTWLSKIFISWSSLWRSVCQWNHLLAPISCLPPWISILKYDHWPMLMVLFLLPHILTACLTSVFTVVWFQTNCQCVLKGKHVGNLTELTFQASCCPFLPVCVFFLHL